MLNFETIVSRSTLCGAYSSLASLKKILTFENKNKSQLILYFAHLIVSLWQNYNITHMKTILKILLAALVLSFVPASYACAQWKNQGNYYDGLALVEDDNEMFGFIDKTGKVVIPCQWKDAWPFSEGLAAVQDFDKKWGYIDKTGKVVIPCKWLEAECFENGRAYVRDEKWYYIDKTGKIVE